MKGEWANMQRLGERNGAAKLSEADVHLLRALMAQKDSNRSALARRFNVTRQALIHIENGRNWGTT